MGAQAQRNINASKDLHLAATLHSIACAGLAPSTAEDGCSAVFVALNFPRRWLKLTNSPASSSELEPERSGRLSKLVEGVRVPTLQSSSTEIAFELV
jgi:hypothetical protein